MKLFGRDRPAERFQTFRNLKYAFGVLGDLRGVFPRECNLCGFTGRFFARGRPPRYDSKCPQCSSAERHRLVALVMEATRVVQPGDRVLHFAPEPAIKALFVSAGAIYTSADIRPGVGDLQIDLENVGLPESSYDVVMCSHVLEHVDDKKALLEIYRVLRPQGRLVMLVPIIEGWATTYEDSGVRTERARLREFGQEDHVRYYGRDFRERVRSAGFSLEEHVGNPKQCSRYGLVRGERVFIAKK